MLLWCFTNKNTRTFENKSKSKMRVYNLCNLKSIPDGFGEEEKIEVYEILDNGNGAKRHTRNYFTKLE